VSGLQFRHRARVQRAGWYQTAESFPTDTSCPPQAHLYPHLQIGSEFCKRCQYPSDRPESTTYAN
jgi:hypothetical protein